MEWNGRRTTMERLKKMKLVENEFLLEEDEGQHSQTPLFGVW